MSEFTTPLKRCNKCGNEYPLTPEFWHKSKNKRGEPSLASQCKDCARARAKKWGQDNAELNRVRAKQWADEHPDRVSENKRQYHLLHKPERQAYAKAHADHRRELKRTPAYKAQAADYRKRKNAERTAYNRQYRSDHPGHYTMLTREWRHNNPEKAKATIHRRIAARHAAGGTYTVDDVKRMYAEQDGRCAYCGIPIYFDLPKDVHVDHVMPLARGGSNAPDNLRLSCQTCNQSKNAKTVAEWQAVRGW